jgi:CRISPR-associated protein Csx17
MFDFANRAESGDAADRWALTNVLMALGRAERILSGGLRFCDDKHIRPLQGLDAGWADHAYDGSAEFRLAAALAGIRSEKEIGPFRIFLEPVENHGTRFAWDVGSTSAVWSNRPLSENLAAVFRRRMMESFRAGRADVPLASRRHAPVADVVAFLRNEVDDEKLSDLVWGLSAVGPGDAGVPDDSDGDIAVPFEFGLPRLLVAPVALRPAGDRWVRADRGAGYVSTPDPAVFQSLARDVSAAVNAAARRLKADGLLATGYRNRQQAGRELAVTSPIPPVRLLAAMLFPLSDRDLVRVANAVLYPPETDE